VPQGAATAPDQRWSMDFVSDRFADGRWFRVLIVVDQFTRECLLLLADSSLSGEKVAAALERVVGERRAPISITVDHGSEFASQAMDLWAYQNGVRMVFSRPGKPTDNAFVESFNGTFQAECLDAHWFPTLTVAREIVEAWRREYNESRPHRALGERTPNEFTSQIAASRDLTGLQTAENSP